MKRFVILFVLVAVVLFAQDASQFAQAQKDNAAKLKEYTWKSRTELKLKGESKKITLEQVRYDMDGQLQKTPIGGAPEAQQQQQQQSSGGRSGGRLKQKIIEQKKEEFADTMKGLVQLASSYASVKPEKWQQFMQTATKSQENGVVKISGKGVQLPDDSVAICVNPQNWMLQRVEIQTIYDKNPVSIKLEYKSIQDGPTYPGRTSLSYPAKQIELTVDNYDHQKLGS